MNWKRRLEQLAIGASINEDGVAVARLSNNRFIVLKDGFVFDQPASRATVGFSISRALKYITGERSIVPCADCGSPRRTGSYCGICWSRRTQESKRRASA